MSNKVTRIPTNNNLTPEQHMEAADDFIATAEERQNDPQWALVEIEIAKAHMLAAALKTALRFADGQSYHGLAAKAAPAIIGLVGKIAR